jgi:O-antigen ligase
MTAVRKRGSTAFVLACLALVSVGTGRAIVHAQSLDASPLQIGLGAVGAVVGLVVMLAGPVACLAAVAALTVLRIGPQAAVGGGVDLTAADAFVVALVCWWLIRTSPERQRGDRDTPPALRVGPVVVLLAYAGLTLLYVAAVDPGRLPVSLVSWIRLVETAALGWFAAEFLQTRRDVTVVLGAIALAGAIAIVVALVGGAGAADAGPLGARGGGFVNPNTLGLVSGLLVLMGTFGALGPSSWYRVPLTIWGVVGVVQSQSVGSIVGTSVALVLGLAFGGAGPRRLVAARALRATIALAIGLALAYGVAGIVRPENLPTSQHFNDSSAGQRAVLGAAGLDLAEHHPLTGVGWRRSEEPGVIGDPDLNTRLRARFPATRNDFFPDVTPGSVHNAYIQIAADLGLIGLALLAIVFVSLARQITAVLDRATRRDRAWPQLWFLTWGLVLIVIWWNDNPIFGGQAETVIPALFVGAVAGLSARDRRAHGARAGADRPLATPGVIAGGPVG